MMPWSPAPSSLLPFGVDALRDMRRLAVEIVLEAEALPVEALLLVADPFHRRADGRLDLFPGARRPFAIFVDALAADLAGEHDELGRGQRLAGDARLRVLGQEQVDDRIGNLVATLSGWPSDTDSDVKR
jgi:hypothetical protein